MLLLFEKQCAGNLSGLDPEFAHTGGNMPPPRSVVLLRCSCQQKVAGMEWKRNWHQFCLPLLFHILHCSKRSPNALKQISAKQKKNFPFCYQKDSSTESDAFHWWKQPFCSWEAVWIQPNTFKIAHYTGTTWLHLLLHYTQRGVLKCTTFLKYWFDTEGPSICNICKATAGSNA